MSCHSIVSLVTDQPARTELGGTAANIPVVHFGARYGSTFDVQLPSTLTPAQKAAWFRHLAEQASDLAIQIERAAAVIA